MGAVTLSPVAVGSGVGGGGVVPGACGFHASHAALFVFFFLFLSGVKVIYLQYIHAFVQLPIPA